MFRRSFLLGSSIFAFSSSLTTISLAPVATAAALAITSPTPSLSSSSSSPDQLSISSSINTFTPRDLDPTKNKFIRPDPFGRPRDFSNNTVYAVGATLEVEWISEWQTVDVSLCQPTDGDTFGCYTLLRQTLSKGYHIQFDGKETDHMSGFGSAPIPGVYYLKLAQTNTLTPTIQSHYFNVSKEDGDGAGDVGAGGSANGTDITTPSTGANGTAAATPSSAASGSSSSSSGPMGSQSSSAGETGTNGLNGVSLAARIAIYTIPAVVVAGLAGAGIFWLILRSRQKKRAAKLAKVGIVESTSTLTSPIPLQEMHSDSFVHETGSALPHEISSHEVPMELPAEIPGLAVSTYEDNEVEPWERRGGEPRDGPR